MKSNNISECNISESLIDNITSTRFISISFPPDISAEENDHQRIATLNWVNWKIIVGHF